MRAVNKLLILPALFVFSVAQADVAATAPMVGAKLRDGNFVDYFYVKNALISSLRTDGNLVISSQTAGSFTVAALDKTSGSGGDVYLKVADISGANCELRIIDGPFQMNPSVKDVHCFGGLNFSGVDHPYGSYEYTLKFNR